MTRRRLVTVTALLVFAFLPCTNATAQTPDPPEPWGDSLTLELWSTSDRIIHGDRPVEERLLREAQYTLAAMIFGFDFIYTPEYADRNVARFFELTSLGTIPWGDPRLDLREITYDETTLYGLMEYELSEFDRTRLRSWQNSDMERASGMGHAPLLDGLSGKIAAIEDAIHTAIRNHLRTRYLNRPREVTGTVVLRSPPRIRTEQGRYEAQVSLYLHIRDVKRYTVF